MAAYPTGVVTQATVVWGGNGSSAVDVPVTALGTSLMASASVVAAQTSIKLRTGYVRASDTSGQVMTGGTTLALFGTVTADTDGAWTANNLFTAPYSCHATISAALGETGTTNTAVQIRLNGAVLVIGAHKISTISCGGAVSATIRLNAGDTIAIGSSLTITRNTGSLINWLSIFFEEW